MKLFKQSYYLLIFSAISLAMVFFMKINKQNFYSHYFKVIEEVELRNSQEVNASVKWGIFAASLEKTSLRTFVQSLDLGILSGHILIETVFVSESEYFLKSLPNSFFYLFTHPIRAP